MLQISIRGTEPDHGQSRERHSTPGERVHQDATAFTWEDEPAAARALVPSEAAARKAEGLGAGQAVEGAVRESEQWQRRWHGELLGGGAPLGAHGGEAGSVGVRREEAEHQAGQFQRDVRPRRRRRREWLRHRAE